jgi:hypothetical protein
MQSKSSRRQLLTGGRVLSKVTLTRNAVVRPEPHSEGGEWGDGAAGSFELRTPE